MHHLKIQLLEYCQTQVDLRFSRIKQMISNIEESLLEESKSSSGDKHETGRAMLQIERENTGKQLLEVEKVMQVLKKIDVDNVTDYARLGSLVLTDKFNYFISLSLGNVKLNGKDYLCVALNSPVGVLLSGKKKGEEFLLNANVLKITEIF